MKSSSERSAFRVGIGFDLHRMQAGRPCLLGGVSIAHEKGPVGHSDGDALLHALADALLGAAGLEDLGTLFSDKDPRWKGASSRELLAQVVVKIREAGWSIVNVDVILIAEAPKIAPHRPAMRRAIAQTLGIAEDCVNVKGKTAESLGPLGAGEAIAAQAVALLEK